jgi:chemotaxis response regulator CheB
MKRGNVGDQVLVKAVIKQVIEKESGLEYQLQPENSDMVLSRFYADEADVITCSYCTDRSNLHNICEDCAEKMYGEVRHG